MTLDAIKMTYQVQWLIGTDGVKESREFKLSECLDDDDDDDDESVANKYTCSAYHLQLIHVDKVLRYLWKYEFRFFSF